MFFVVDFRQVVGPSIREMKEAMKTFVQIAMKNNDSPVKTKDEQNQQQPGLDENSLVSKPNRPLTFLWNYILAK